MDPAHPISPTTIVYIEDNQGDVLLLQQAFEERAYGIRIQVIPDWDQALHYLKVKETARDAPPPDLILLDHQLPKGDGKGLLMYINGSEYLKTIPAYLFTSGDHCRQMANDIPPDRCLEKPVAWDGFLALADRFIATIRQRQAERMMR
jgi:CheY-like chemotaxis protein